MAHWWRSTAPDFFDRMPKARILEASDAVGGPELVSRYVGSKKADLASAAERVLSGEFIGEKNDKQPALAGFLRSCVPALSRKKPPAPTQSSPRSEDAGAELTEQAPWPS